jgi:hypothetical protein
MSRFDELCEALRGVRRQYAGYRDECFRFVGRFLEGFRDYLGAPPGHVNLYAKLGPLAGRKLDGPAAALHLADDGWWHFGIAIDLCEDPNVLPYDTVGFDLRLKYAGGRFLLALQDHPPFEFSNADPPAMAAVYDHMFHDLKTRYEQSFRDFLEKGDATRRLGF